MDNNFKLDLGTLPKEFSLLLEIIKLENKDYLQLKNNELFTNIDWEKFLKLAIHHRVYPLIYSKLKKTGENWVPSEVIKTLNLEYKKNTFQMLHLSGEMEKINKLFVENQIRLLFLKGPVVAADLYGDISLRTSKDLDILVPIPDLKRASELLLNLGYEKVKLAPFEIWKWRNHHETYIHPQKKINIEIHWGLHPRPTIEPSFNDLWERKRISSLTNYPLYFLGEMDLYFYLIAHGARHGWFRLRWLSDIDRIIRKRDGIEKSNVKKENFEQYHLGKQASLLEGQTLILTSQLLNTPINEENKILTEGRRSRKLAQNALYYIREMTPLSSTSSEIGSLKFMGSLLSLKSNLQKSYFINRYLFASKSQIQRFFYILNLFYPKSADVETLVLPNYLHFLYFPLRPILWAWRKLGKQA
ncbi:nucleotidyltransferase family protein [Peribacillus frigoritolerans]|uniref:nucleotidyltransferase domain-containing protein n=1 Tax=Peribacillus frigoritolerans TaxID=450367 RepID=UPI0034E077A3